MEQILQSKLKPEETLLWTGKPGNFEVLDKTNKSRIIKKMIIVVVAVIAVLALYIMYATSRDLPINAVMIVLALVVGVLGVSGDFTMANKLKNKTLYALTDMRMIVVCGTHFEAVPYENVDGYDFVTDEDGHTTLICGDTAREEGNAARRTATVRGAVNDTESGRCHSFAMYALEDVDAVNKIMEKHLAHLA